MRLAPVAVERQAVEMQCRFGHPLSDFRKVQIKRPENIRRPPPVPFGKIPALVAQRVRAAIDSERVFTGCSPIARPVEAAYRRRRRMCVDPVCT